MGLTITVGIMDGLKGDEESIEAARRGFDKWNVALRDANLETHEEPEVVKPTFDADMGGYSTLHYCRRAAARLWKTGSVAPLGDGEPQGDSTYAEYLAQSISTPIEGQSMNWVASPSSGERNFDHLIYHSDAEGVYLPISFERVLQVDHGVYVEEIGSVTRLLSECKEVARALRIPRDVLLDLDAAYEGLESPHLWGGFGREALGLAVLMAACRASNLSGAALILH